MQGLPDKMRGVQLMGHGGLEQLRYAEDLPVPQPGRGEVLVRIAAAALNNTDLNLRSGWYAKAEGGSGGWQGSAVAFPRIQGLDGCGHIAAVGEGVPPARMGERVLVDPILRVAGAASPYAVGYFGSDRDGAFAQYACVPAENAVQVYASWSDAELATLPCSYLVAEEMMERAHVGTGMSVLVLGASGGVGSAAVQLARRRGARVLGVAGMSKAAALRGLGVADVLARETDLLGHLGPGSVEVVIDTVGGADLTRLMELLQSGGRYAVCGAVAGAHTQLDLRAVYLRDLTLHGCTVPRTGLMPRLLEYVARGEIRPLVARRYPLSRLADAQAEFAARRHVGKIVVEVD
jgi:NADPH:quinone reductase-like Zn-dependent oxidoreductase